MSDYISREAALEALCADCCTKECNKELCQDWHNLSVVPAADVALVVRCEDCEMANPCSDDSEMYCTLNHCYKRKNYFCADGMGKADMRNLQYGSGNANSNEINANKG